MQLYPLSLGGAAARAACLVVLASAGCSNSGKDVIDREVNTREAGAEEDAAEPELDEDAEAPEPDPADAAALRDAASAVDASVPNDASVDAALQPGAVTPKNYLRPQDSPFAAVDFAYFHLEDFEDHLLNTPGLRSVTSPVGTTPAGQASSSFGPSVIDSVDGDDGIPNDNRCEKADGGLCDAWWGQGRLTFNFDVNVLGALPTHVGGVWTDGLGQVSFEAFGPTGNTVYKVGPLSEPGFPDNTVSSSTAEDRFFGAYHPDGISAFTIFNTQGGIEIDHVQYGRAR